MESLSSALAVLTAMITPAVLISACGTMILSTSSRLGRVVDRVRSLSDKLEELAHVEGNVELLDDRRAVIFVQLDRLTSRARILQRSMTTFYVALGIFVSTSVAIGIVAVTSTRYRLDSRRRRAPRRGLPVLRQHPSHLRSTTGFEHYPYGDGFHLAFHQALRTPGACRKAQGAFRAF